MGAENTDIIRNLWRKRTVIKIALRDSQTATRPYVLLNPLLAKHLPVTPSHSLKYFALLGAKVAAVCKEERVLVIGFAETATALGAVVAAAIDNAVYVHTTREKLPDHQLVADFREEHSHAKNQTLYLKGVWKNLNQYDRIVFVDDEITTGKTILNFLQSTQWNGKITVSALVFQGFDETAFAQYKAEFVCLQRTGYVRFMEIGSLPDPRSGVLMDEYNRICRDISAQIISSIDDQEIRGKNLLVLGTEEFMYPALILGRELEKAAKSVVTQSTTRSPLLPQDNAEYPIQTRISFLSVYDDSRITYLYNMRPYDTLIIITDTEKLHFEELLRALQNCGNQVIYCVRLRTDA